MAVFGTKQDADITRRDGARLARRRIANERVGVEQPADLGGDSFGMIRDARRRDNAERVGHWDGQLDWESIVLAEAERVAPGLVLLDLREQVVRKRQQLRHRPEALRDRPARITVGAQPVYERAGVVHDTYVGVAKTINRLFAIPHDKNRRNERSGVRYAAAFPPGTDEQRHE